MIRVYVKDGEPIEIALKRFKQKCKREGIVAEARQRSFFLKPSERRRARRHQRMRRVSKLHRP